MPRPSSEAYLQEHQINTLRSTESSKTFCRPLPLWVTWCGIPAATTRAILGITGEVAGYHGKCPKNPVTGYSFPDFSLGISPKIGK